VSATSDILSRALDRSGRTLLHVAAALQGKATVPVLLEFSADPTALDKTGRTPLHVACEYGNLDAIKALLPCSPKASDRLGRCPIHLAACSDSLEAVQALLDYSPSLLTTEDSHGRSPLVYSILNKYGEVGLEISDLLLARAQGPRCEHNAVSLYLTTLSIVVSTDLWGGVLGEW
jgi:ankyrin repeat protein